MSLKKNNIREEKVAVVELDKVLGEQEVRDGIFVASRKTLRTPPPRWASPAQSGTELEAPEGEGEKDMQSQGEDEETAQRRRESPSNRARSSSIGECCARQVDKGRNKRIRESPKFTKEDSMDSDNENEKRAREERQKEREEFQREKVFKRIKDNRKQDWNSKYREISDRSEGNKDRGEAEASEGNDLRAKIFMEVIEKITKEIRTLREIVFQNRNTKVELKDSSSALEDLVDQLDDGEYISYVKKILKEKVGGGRSTVTHTGKEPKSPERMNASTQTESDPWKLRNERSAAGIRERIKKCEEVQDILEVASLNWPKEAYKVTREGTGNPIMDNNEKDLAIFISMESKYEDAVGSQICNRFPEIAEESVEEGTCVLAYEVKTERGNGTKQVSRRTISSIVVDEDEGTMVKNVIKWKEKIIKHKLKRVAIPFTDVIGDKVRKLIECILWDSEVNILMYTTQKQKGIEGRQRLEKGADKRRVSRNVDTEVVLVKGEGKSYADLLRKVKDKVDINSLGVTVKGVRKTREGELLLEVDKKDKTLGTLKNEITKCFNEEEGVTIREGRRNMTTVMFRGIDATVTMEEVSKVIKETAKVEGEEMKVVELKTSFDSNKNALVSVTRELASTLLELREMRIGWSTCRISQRKESKRCIRCWDVGHFARECNGEDRSNCCLKCGGEGHKVQQCTNEPFCPICDRRGHRADSMLCPILRKRVEAFRQGERRQPRIKVNPEPTQRVINQGEVGVATSAQGTAQVLEMDTHSVIVDGDTRL